MSRSSSESHEQTYGIGAVAKLTGLSDHTISHTAAIIGAMAAPTTRIVSLTITEGGYLIGPATGEFDPAEPAHVPQLGACSNGELGWQPALDQRPRR